MRASHVVFLSLAASAAVPVFAVPISYVVIFTAVTDRADLPVPILNSDFKARSESGDSRDGCAEGMSDQPEVFELVERNVPHDVTGTPELPTAHDTSEDFPKAILENRDLSPRQDIQARGLSDLFKIGSTLMSQVLRRNVSPEELLARDGMEDLVNSIISRNTIPEQQKQAEDGFARIIKAATSSRRDVASDELTARDNWDNLAQILNSRDMQPRATSLFTSFLAWVVHKFMSIRGRDLTPGDLAGRDAAINDLVDDYMSQQHSAREPSPQQVTQARSVESDAFLKALLQSRDLSRRATTEDVLRLLASRALDDLE